MHCSGYVTGDFPPGVKDLRRAVQVQAAMLRAHAAAYRAIHELQPEARVGYALHYRPMQAQNHWSPLDRLVRSLRYAGVNMAFPSAISSGVLRSPVGKIAVPEAQGKQDFVGLNYYSVDTVSFSLSNRSELFTHAAYPQDADVSDYTLHRHHPAGTIRLAPVGGEQPIPILPILITENGVE